MFQKIFDFFRNGLKQGKPPMTKIATFSPSISDISGHDRVLITGNTGNNKSKFVGTVLLPYWAKKFPEIVIGDKCFDYNKYYTEYLASDGPLHKINPKLKVRDVFTAGSFLFPDDSKKNTFLLNESLINQSLVNAISKIPKSIPLVIDHFYFTDEKLSLRFLELIAERTNVVVVTQLPSDLKLTGGTASLDKFFDLHMHLTDLPTL